MRRSPGWLLLVFLALSSAAASSEQDLADASGALQTANENCMKTAADHEATVTARAKNVKINAQAKQILVDSTGAAESQAYSFLQAGVASCLRTRSDLVNAEVLSTMKMFANEHHSATLAQVASRIAAVLQFGSSASEDPFSKVKGLITELIAKVEMGAGSEATEKAYCDDHIAKPETKNRDLEDDVASLGLAQANNTIEAATSTARSSRQAPLAAVLLLVVFLVMCRNADAMPGFDVEDHAKAKLKAAEYQVLARALHFALAGTSLFAMTSAGSSSTSSSSSSGSGGNSSSAISSSSGGAGAGDGGSGGGKKRRKDNAHQRRKAKERRTADPPRTTARPSPLPPPPPPPASPPRSPPWRSRSAPPCVARDEGKTARITHFLAGKQKPPSASMKVKSTATDASWSGTGKD